MAATGLAQRDCAGILPADDYSVTVLLVDDQATVGHVIRRALGDLPNFYFYHCANPQEAISLAERINPTVILQDLVLPGIDGLTLVERYRANPFTLDVPVIVLSSEEKAAVKSEAFKLGASDYLVKPPDPVELIARLRHHTKAYLNQVQRDEAYRSLHEAQQQLMQLNTELQRLTKVDGLTGLCNRRYLDDYLLIEWKRAVREQTALSVLMIDVDCFKPYNDTYGHLCGDEVLKKVATAIRQSLSRPADVAARFGGEEFIGILPNTALAGARHVAEKVRRIVEALRIPHSASGAGAHVTISIGVASAIPRRDTPLTDLLEAEDVALYRAKKAGKNRVAS